MPELKCEECGGVLICLDEREPHRNLLCPNCHADHIERLGLDRDGK